MHPAGIRGRLASGFWSRSRMLPSGRARGGRQALSEQYARGLFEHSPVSLWVEDFSGIKRLLDEVREPRHQRFPRVHRRASGVRPALHERNPRDRRQPAHARRCSPRPTRQTLLNRLGDIFRDDMEPHFREQLIDLWHGKLFQQREVVNYALDGSELHLHLQFSVLPGHERDWSLVQSRAHRHHGAQEGRGLSGIPRPARCSDQALQPLVLRRRAQSSGAQGAISGHDHRRRSQRPEGRQRPVGPCRRRRSAAPRRRGLERGDCESRCTRRASAATSSRCCCRRPTSATAQP